MRSIFLFLLVFISVQAIAQIEITFPVSRIVFQRDNQNKATINIAGNYYQTIDKIEARCVPFVAGQGTETSWVVIQNNPAGGIFNGTISLNGGWYRLEVRASLAENIVATTQLDRVGVGEVFLVAGQSNAEGQAIYPGGNIGASEDRVSSINYLNYVLDENSFPFQFSQLADNNKIAPYNPVPWFWSRLGDLMVKKLNVPILFYGSSIGGIGSDLWRRSAAGEDLTSQFGTFIKVPGMPYRAMKATLQQYATRTGIRAILWQQGESDDINSSTTYFNNMNFVINQTRQDSKKTNLAWVIARSSRNPTIHQNVIEGQSQLVLQLSNVFSGPNTDDIYGSDIRYDGIHFMNTGLSHVASIWDDFLNESFLTSSTPMAPSRILNVSLACNTSSDNSFSLRTDDGYNTYKWSNGQSATTSIITGSGTYSVKASDNVGNTYFSQSINIANLPTKLTITANRPTNIFCQGESIILSANKNSDISWNTGATTPTIEVKNSGNYSVTNKTVYGCSFLSNPFNVLVNPAPSLSVTTDGPTSFCLGNSVKLSASSNTPVTYTWSTGATTKDISVNDTRNVSVKVVDNNGCQAFSNTFAITSKALPSTPFITQKSIYTLEEISTGTLIGNSFEWKRDNTVLTPTTTAIKVNTTGSYTVRAGIKYPLSTTETLTCYSPSSNPFNFSIGANDNGLAVYPNPSQNGIVNFETIEDLPSLQIGVYTPRGQIVYIYFVSDLSQARSLNLKSLQRGHYVLQISGNNFKRTKRIILDY